MHRSESGIINIIIVFFLCYVSRILCEWIDSFKKELGIMLSGWRMEVEEAGYKKNDCDDDGDVAIDVLGPVESAAVAIAYTVSESVVL